MEEEKKKRKKSVSSSSKIQKNKELTADELLDQIMNKKKNKKSNSNKTNVSKTTKKETLSSEKKVSDDELLEAILAKKQTKKSKSNTNSSVKQKKETAKSPSDKVVEKEVSESKNNRENVKTDECKNKEKNLNEDLIITREINFDEKLDLNNKKVLAQLRKAIEDFDNLEDLEEIHSSLDLLEEEKKEEKEIIIANKHNYDDSYLTDAIITRDKKRTKVKYDNNEKQRFILILGIIILVALLIFIIFVFVDKSFSMKHVPTLSDNSPLLYETKEKENDLKEIQYQNCKARQVDERDYTDSLYEKQSQLTEYLAANYKTSVAYEDLTYGFKYNYNEGNIYYAASTIKSLDALYIYTKASLGEINLDDTLTYSSKFRWSSSKAMSSYKYGSKVTIRELVKYAVTVSDNSAHQMLVDYIGRDNLKKFGLELGATEVLKGFDNFGNINVNDAIIYFRAIDNFIKNNEVLGEELKSYFLQAEQNDLAIPELEISAGHKYGQYSSYYHDIGIVYDNNPYLIAILTTEGSGDYEAKVKDINKHVYELHKFFLENREKICKAEVYGN